MEAVLYKTPKTNSLSGYSRSPKAYPTKISFPVTKLNKENSLHSSYTEKYRTKREDRDSPSIMTSSIERESNIAPSRVYNRSCRVSPNYLTNNTIYTSPKHAEIDLLTQNLDDSTTNTIKPSHNHITSSEKKAPQKTNEKSSTSVSKKRGKEESKSQYKLRERLGHSRDSRDNRTLTPSIEDKINEKITIYTRILNSMKPLSPKSKDLMIQKPNHTSPKNPMQRTSIDLAGLSGEVKKLSSYVSSASPKMEVSNSSMKKEEPVDGHDLQPFKKEPVPITSNRQKESPKSQSSAIPKEREARVEVSRKQDRHYTKDRFSLTKKLTIDIHEPLETGESETSKNGRDNSSSIRYTPNLRGHDSYSLSKREFDKTYAVSKSGTFDRALYNNFLRDSKEMKAPGKSITPKVVNGRASPEIKKLFTPPNSLSGMMSQIRAREPSLSKESTMKKESSTGTTPYQNFLKSRTMKPREDSRDMTENAARRPPSVAKSIQEKKLEDDQGPKSEKGSTVGLKDFVTQISAGTGLPLRSGLELKTQNFSHQSLLKKRHNSQSTKNATTKKITLTAQTAQTPLSRPNKISFAARTLGPPRDGRSFGFNPHYSYMNVRNLVVKTEGDQVDSYSDFNNDPPLPDYNFVYPLYYMSNIAKYLKGVDSDGSAEAVDEYFEKIYKEHFLQTFQAVNFCKYLKSPELVDLTGKVVTLEKRETHKDKKTIIFDLDETLIHCNENASMPCDAIIPIKFPHGDVIDAGINIRPYTRECLEELSRDFEIIVFTASHSAYANVALDHLDPENKYIHHRLFRDHCIVTEEGLYIKDLRVLSNRDLKDVVIVDNAVYSFGYHLENGIPIIPFYFNKNDTELMSLTAYLKSLANVQDVRQVNRRVFKL